MLFSEIVLTRATFIRRSFRAEIDEVCVRGATLHDSFLFVWRGSQSFRDHLEWRKDAGGRECRNVVDSRHKEIDEATEAVWLCDIFPVKDAGGQIVAVQSIGDIFIELAVFVVHLNLCFLFALGIYEAKKSLKPKKDL